MTHYMTTSEVDRIVRAARRLGCDAAARGSRVVVVTDEETTLRDVMLRAGIVPTTHHVDRDDLTSACAAWL